MNNLIKEILKNTPLNVRLTVCLEMNLHGKLEEKEIEDLVKTVLEKVEQWKEDGKPE